MLAGGIDRIREILVDIGLEYVSLEPETRLRADLSLDSQETTRLEAELARRLNVRVNLWDEHDYALGELADLADGGASARS